MNLLTYAAAIGPRWKILGVGGVKWVMGFDEMPFHPRNRQTAKVGKPFMSDQVTMYSTTWCGYCRRLKSQFEREGIDYREVNIEEDPAAAEFVTKVNGGNQTVPTVVLPDGTAMTNPPIKKILKALAASGSN